MVRAINDPNLDYWECLLTSSRGCITPKIVENVVTALVGKDGSPDNVDDFVEAIDGWEDMSEEWQAKILTMLKEGHVPDEDWKGVSSHFSLL